MTSRMYLKTSIVLWALPMAMFLLSLAATVVFAATDVAQLDQSQDAIRHVPSRRFALRGFEAEMTKRAVRSEPPIDASTPKWAYTVFDATFNENGSAESFVVVKSSGEQHLDNLALAAYRRVLSPSLVPAALKGLSFHARLDFVFRPAMNLQSIAEMPATLEDTAKNLIGNWKPTRSMMVLASGKTQEMAPSSCHLRITDESIVMNCDYASNVYGYTLTAPNRLDVLMLKSDAPFRPDPIHGPAGSRGTAVFHVRDDVLYFTIEPGIVAGKNIMVREVGLYERSGKP